MKKNSLADFIGRLYYYSEARLGEQAKHTHREEAIQ